MRLTQPNDQFPSLLIDAKNVAVLTHEGAPLDKVAGVLALSNLLSEMGKAVWPLVPGELNPKTVGLPGREKIKKDLGPRNLIISLDYGETTVEKVSYSVEDNRLNLVVGPVSRQFDINRIRYAYEGTSFDTFVTVGVQTLSQLGRLSELISDDLKLATLVNVDYHPDNEGFGHLCIHNQSCAGVCEVLFSHLPLWRIRPSSAVAECLLAGIRETSLSTPPASEDRAVSQAVAHEEVIEEPALSPPPIYTGEKTEAE